MSLSLSHLPLGSLDFFASLVKSLAWPATVIFAVVMFRVPLIALIGRLSEAAVGGVTVSFGKELDKVEEGLPSGESKGVLETAEASEFIQTGLPPQYLINSAWNRLEKALTDISEKRNLGDGRGRFRNSELIASKLGLPPHIQKLIVELRHLRNRAVHGAEDSVTATDALRFEQAVTDIMKQLPKS